MSIPNVNIKLGNGNLGRVAASADGVAGLILTGAAVASKLTLNTPVTLFSKKDLENLGVTTENNPLVKKEVEAFYDQAGDGSELYLIVVATVSTLTSMCANTDDSPMSKLIDYAAGRIRLVGINKLTPEGYNVTPTAGIDPDSVAAATSAQTLAENYFEKVRPFRVLIPACGWDGDTAKLYKPRESTTNRCAFVLSSDGKIGEEYVASVGLLLGRAAKISVCRSLGRVKDGAIALQGWFTNGATVDALINKWDLLHDAGYIFLRKFVAKNGCYVNGDSMAAPVSDDYSELYLGRVVDKAAIIAYTTFVEEIKDNVEVDENGHLPQSICAYFEGNIERNVLMLMQGELSGFAAYVDPAQNILSTSKINISGKVRPLGVLSEIGFDLSFSNPAIN